MIPNAWKYIIKFAGMTAHKATVISVSSRGVEVKADISGKSSCSSCALGSSCGAAADKVFVGIDNVDGTFRPGDQAVLMIIPPSRRRLLLMRVIAPLGALAVTTATALATGYTPDISTAAGIAAAATVALAARFVPVRARYRLTRPGQWPDNRLPQ